MCGDVFFASNRGSTAFVTSIESRDWCREWCGIVCLSLDLLLCSFLSLWGPNADKNTPVLKNFTPILHSFASSCLSFCGATGYKISYRVDSRDPQRWTTVEVGSNGRQFTVTGLSAEQTYVFRLIARTAVGWGEQLEALVVTTERRGQSNVISYLSPSCKSFMTISRLFSSGFFFFVTLILCFMSIHSSEQIHSDVICHTYIFGFLNWEPFQQNKMSS